MKIIDYANQNENCKLKIENSTEIITATLIFLVPIIMLFLLAK